MSLWLKSLLVYYIVINFMLFMLMGIDKLKAKKDKWRIPESTLFLFSIIGGGIGGFAGMSLFHHKTKKTKFYIVFALSIIMHIIGIILL